MDYYSFSEAEKKTGLSQHKLLKAVENGEIKVSERCRYSDDACDVVGYWQLASSDITRMLLYPDMPFDEILYDRLDECPDATVHHSGRVDNLVIFERELVAFADYLDIGLAEVTEDFPAESTGYLLKSRLERIAEVVKEKGTSKRGIIEAECSKDHAMFTRSTFDEAWRRYRKKHLNG